MKFAIGTTNAAKLACVNAVVRKLFPDATIEVEGVAVASAVSAQPFSLDETRAGALHRAKVAAAASSDCDYGIGLEGGVEVIGAEYYECGWMCVVHRQSSVVGWGSSARFQMSNKIVDQLKQGKELAEVMEALSGIEKVGTKGGAMAVLTNDHLSRAEAYSHGLIFAFAPFLSDRAKYWDTA